MVYAGARSDTEFQMSEVMHFSLPQERLHPAFNSLDLTLASRNGNSAGKDEADTRSHSGVFPLTLAIANSIWCQTGHRFLPSFLDTIASNYGTGIRQLDFKTSPEASRTTINDWVSNETHGRMMNPSEP